MASTTLYVHFSRVLQVIHEFSLFKYIYLCSILQMYRDDRQWYVFLTQTAACADFVTTPNRFFTSTCCFLNSDLVNLHIYITPATKMTKRFRSEVAWTTLLKMCLVSSSHKSFFLPLIHSFIYRWSISHILEHKFFCLGHLGSSHCK